MEAVVLHRVGFLAYFCPKQGQDFKPSAAPLYPNMGKVPPPPPGVPLLSLPVQFLEIFLAVWQEQGLLLFSLGAADHLLILNVWNITSQTFLATKKQT